MFERLYRWAMVAGDSPRALWAFALISFGESAMLPLPVDAVSIPIMLASPRRVWHIALIGTVTSVLGGMAGYGIGFFFTETLGAWLIEIYGLQQQFAEFQQSYAEMGWFVVLVGGITPLPYKLTSIASGILEYPFGMFILMSGLARGLRFFAISAGFWYFGPALRIFMDRNATLVGWAILALLASGFAATYLIA